MSELDFDCATAAVCVRLNLNIFYCLINDKRIRHKFFNLVFTTPYEYNMQYDMYYYCIIFAKN